MSRGGPARAIAPLASAWRYVVMPENTRISSTGSVVTTMSVENPGESVHTDVSRRSITSQMRVGGSPT